MNMEIHRYQMEDERQPHLYLHQPDAAQGKPKIIGDIGVNSAYIDPGDSCLSIRHGSCALIVLTNGTSSFAVHLLSSRSTPQLMDVFGRIKQQLGGAVKAKLYQEDIDTKASADNEDLQGYISILETVVGKENVEQHGFGWHPDTNLDFLITANGNVTELMWQDEARIRRSYFPREDDLNDPRWEQASFGSGPVHITEYPRFIGASAGIGKPLVTVTGSKQASQPVSAPGNEPDCTPDF